MAEVAAFGAALNRSFGTPLASGAQAEAGACEDSESVVSIPAGVTVDAIRLAEDLTIGQSIARYTLEVQQKPGEDAPWLAVLGAHGQTVGSQLVDLLDAPLHGPSTVRWRCTEAVSPSPAQAAKVRLRELSAFLVRAPVGWVKPATTTWALQSLYSPVAQDMTPCATRSGVTATNSSGSNSSVEERSSCSAYMTKAGAKYAYVRDEHCCMSPPDAATAHARGLVPLFLHYNAHNDDHMLYPNASFAYAGNAYHTSGPECYGYPSPPAASQRVGGGASGGEESGATAPLDIYWSAERKDMWSLASNASRAQALAQGYVLVHQDVARVPVSC